MVTIQRIAYAVDQQQLVDVGQQGSGAISQTPFPTYPPLMKYIDSIQDVLDEYNVLEVDLQKSEDLMIEAGFEKDGDGFTVTRSDLTLTGNVPEADQAKFEELAKKAKENCPISKLLNAEITLETNFSS